MKALKAVICLLVVVAMVISLNSKFGDIPPIGKFLDPFNGFWANAESKNHQNNRQISLEGLHGAVTIKFDNNRIPHIFAGNNYDVYYAQGYITARDRLWQMDFQTRFASGRLSEVVGVKAVELDRYQRRMGMTYGAEQMVESVKKDPVMTEVIKAYTAGINAYIHSLKPGDYPIEFKILNYQPEDWEPINCALLLKLMSSTLTSGSDEFYMSNVLNKFGPDIVSDLFPDYPFRIDPIIPPGTQWNFKPVSIPNSSDTSLTSGIITKQKRDGIGSNNWALSGSKTATGYPMLANDPHLDLTLPAIWYQIQLVSNDMNVYGVSIPGAPGVIIGFNQNVAWGVTNVGADVLDWYQVKFKDNKHNEYWFNNQWMPVKKRIETIAIRNGKTVTDTVLYTHHGPVVYLKGAKPAHFSKAGNIPEGNALRWSAHLPSNDVRTFYMLNRAKNYSDYRQALVYFTAPAQNFAFADVQNNIGVTPTGYFPLKRKAQGKFILDGSKPENDWHGRIPFEQGPTVKNPPRGFISSANQFSTDQTYPYYINWEFSATERGRRINSRLTSMTGATVDSMRNLQNDNYSMLAQDILPVMVSSIQVSELNKEEKKGFDIIKKWNRFYNAQEIGASIFEIWQKYVISNIWKDEFGDANLPMRFPSRDRTVELLINEPASKWFDKAQTPIKETREDIIHEAFKLTIDSLSQKFGPIGRTWEWANVKGSHVPHLAKISGFGSGLLYNGGSKHSVNALGESNGPSWRMVVALGKDVKGYGVFPGGQSGNPGSFFYDDMIEPWTNGRLNELLYLKSEKEASNRIISTWTLKK
ncbi:MAG TPA: penicillin acylase family protein [Sphingobacteriaceae bacterium]